MSRNFIHRAMSAISVGGCALLAAACLDTPTEFRCSAVVNEQATVRADSIITTTGLIYRDLHAGTGAVVESTDDCQVARVQFEGRLTDGTVFSQTAGTQTFAFTVGDGMLIAGFEQGMVGMRVGGQRQLIIPPDLGYGDVPQRDASGAVVIPAGSTLVFDVTLVALD